MNSNEWPLVFFTMLSQISLGIVLSSLIAALVLRNLHTDIPIEVKRVAILAAMVIMGVALAISFFHLASPLHSIYALSNVSSSWLSREILLGSMYFFTVAVCFASIRFNIPHRELMGHLLLASLFTGAIFIWTMAGIYMIPTVPLWNTPATPIAFFNTSLMLGSCATLIILTLYADKVADLSTIRLLQSSLFYIVAAAVFISLLNMLILQPDTGSVMGSFGIPQIPSWIKALQTVALLSGFSVLAYWFAFRLATPAGPTSYLIYIAAACLFLAELSGRYLFYASYYRLGV